MSIALRVPIAPPQTQSLSELLSDGLFIDGDWVETKDQDPTGDVRLIQLADVGDGIFRDRSARYLTMRKAHELNCTFLEPGDVLVARMPDPLGRACVFPGVGQPAVTAVDVCVMRPNPQRASAEWLMFAINSLSFRSAMSEHIRGTTRQRISRKNLGTLRLIVPPLPQQIGVVEYLRSVTDAAKLATHNVSSARRLIDRFRQSILAAACAGSLTADWRSDGGVEGMPRSWHPRSIADLAADVPRAIQSGPFGSNLLHSEFVSTGMLVIGIDNVLDGQFSIGRNHRIAPAKFDSLKKYAARPRDVLITVMGTVGRVCTVPETIEPALITKHVYRITVNPRLADPDFVALALRGHPTVREQIREQERGQTRPGINGTIVKGLHLNVPPIDEQREIINRVRVLLDRASVLETCLGAIVSVLDRSVRSVVDRNFNYTEASS